MINLVTGKPFPIFIFFLLLSIFTRYIKLFIGDLIYLIVLLPMLFYVFLSFFTKKKLILQYFDVVLIFCFSLLLVNLFLSGVRGVLHSQAIFIVYIFIPFLFYFSIRKVDLKANEYFKFLVFFSLIYALVTIAEFFAYMLDPSLQGVITTYMRDVVQNNNFHPPHVEYPIIGEQTKPWGPMFDASGNGAFLAVLTCFVYERYKSIRSKWLWVATLVLFVSVFISGSKSAYLMVLLYFVVKNIGGFLIRPSLNRSLIFVFTLVVGASIFALFLSFFFTPDVLDFYLEAFLFLPISNFYDGLIYHGLFLFFGLGQETSVNIIVGTGEVDLINSMFRYGIIFTILIVSVLMYLSILSFKKYPEFFALFFMSVLAMNHYQVSFKYPASIIIFMGIAVYLNERALKKAERVNFN